MSTRTVKEALFDEFARVAKALSNGRRAEIIDILSNGDRSVESIAKIVRQSVANTSQHLQILKHAGLVTSRRQGTFVYYSLSSPEVLRFWRSLQKVAQRSSGDAERLIREYLGDEDVEEITSDELSSRLRRKDELIVVDVRPHEEYAAGHLPGAVSIPLEELEERLGDLPKGKHVVAYCRGPLCALAPEAARFLKTKGYDVSRLAEGAPDWAAEGRPLETE